MRLPPRLVTHLIVAFAICAAGCSSSRDQATTAPSPARPYDFSLLSKQIEVWIDRKYYPGAGMVVVRKNQVVYQECFGDYTPDTLVYIASAGKWLAAATIASVVDEGKLSWGDRPGKYIPELKGGMGRPTLRQLLSHTAGYEPHQPEGRHPDNYQTLSESVAKIVPLAAKYEPGEQFEYGGLAMQVAGRMAEIAAGKDWETLFQERIAAPLGMTNTHFTPVDEAPGHSPMLGGSARSTLNDYSRFLSMICNEGVFNGKRLLSRRAIAEMQADQVHSAKVDVENEFVYGARGKRHSGIYGLGEWREIVDEHNRAVVLSSPSWTGTYPWIDKKRKLYGAIITHVEGTAAARDGFSAYYASPMLVILVNHAVDEACGPPE